MGHVSHITAMALLQTILPHFLHSHMNNALVLMVLLPKCKRQEYYYLGDPTMLDTRVGYIIDGEEIVFSRPSGHSAMPYFAQLHADKVSARKLSPNGVGPNWNGGWF